MDITLIQGIMITLIAMVIVVDRHLEGFFIFRPIIVCPIIGLVLGDLGTGLIAGGIVELAFAGITGVGGVVAPDAIITSIMTVVIAKTTGQPVAASFALAYPFGVLMQFYWTIKNTLYSFFNKPADRYAKEANLKGLIRICIIGIVINMICTGAITFLSVYAAQGPIRDLVQAMPDWLTHGFDVAGGLIPAIGFAMLLRVILKGKYVPYLLAGFLFATFIQFDNVLPIAIMGLSFALIDYNRQGNEVAVGGEANGGI